MKMTTLCYLENDKNEYLMLHRTKKKDDPNEGKWIGIGGKFEENESPEDCLLREVYEETGLMLKKYDFRGIVTFISDEWETEYMHLFTAEEWTGDMHECSEGTLKWISKSDIENLKLWEGDRIFLRLLAEDKRFFSLKLTYRGDSLESSDLKEY